MQVIVTGANKGIGLEITNEFLKNGHKVLAISRSINNLSKLHSQFPDHLRIASIDISCADNPNAPAELSEQFALLKHADIVINNAGFLKTNDPVNDDLSSFRKHFEINTISPLLIARLLYDKLKLSTHAHIINIGSMGGFQGSLKFSGLSAYATSKGALATLTECLATEWSADRISVNCLCLGAVNTQMLAKAFPGYEAPVSAHQMARFIFDFALSGKELFSGKVIPVSISNPE